MTLSKLKTHTHYIFLFTERFSLFLQPINIEQKYKGGIEKKRKLAPSSLAVAFRLQCTVTCYAAKIHHYTIKAFSS